MRRERRFIKPRAQTGSEEGPSKSGVSQAKSFWKKGEVRRGKRTFFQKGFSLSGRWQRKVCKNKKSVSFCRTKVLFRLPVVVKVLGIGKTTWWCGIKQGRFPKPVKLGPRTSVWRVEDIRALIANPTPAAAPAVKGAADGQ